MYIMCFFFFLFFQFYWKSLETMFKINCTVQNKRTGEKLGPEKVIIQYLIWVIRFWTPNQWNTYWKCPCIIWQFGELLKNKIYCQIEFYKLSNDTYATMIRKEFLKVYFNHTSFAFLDFCWNEVYFKYNSGLEKKFTNLGNLQIHLWVWTWIHKFRKSTSSILQSFRVNTSILKAYFKYTLEFEDNT